MKEMLYRQFVGLALCWCFALTVQAQTLRTATSKYDRATDVTTVHLELLEADETPARLSLQANVTFRGKEPGDTVRCWLSFSQHQRKASRKTPPRLQTATTLTLHADGETFSLPVGDYRKEFYEMIQLFGESATATLEAAVLKTLRTTKQLRGQLGHAEFSLPEKTLTELQRWLKHYVSEKTP